jgi:hypothetical protein
MKPMRHDERLRIVQTVAGYVIVQGVDRKVGGPYPSRTTALWALEAKLPKRRKQATSPDRARS